MKIKLLFFIFLLNVTDVLRSQADFCGNLNSNLGNSTSNSICSDAVWDGGDQTYRLVLEYSTTTLPEVVSAANQIITRYKPLGIKFQIIIIKSNCPDCKFYDDNWWQDFNGNNFKDPGESYDYLSHPYINCLYGRMLGLAPFDYAGFAGEGDFDNGAFWAFHNNETPPHEIGHALGLLHTFNNFSPTNSTNNENVIQNTNTCTCNCTTTGDGVCDTPVNPFLSQFEYPDDYSSWNTSMFQNASSIVNWNDKTDQCNTNYKLITNQIDIFNNIMSYWTTTRDRFSQGQGHRIKFLNKDKSIKTAGNEFIIVQLANYNISTSTTFDYNLYLKHDLNLSGSVTFKNCIVYVNSGKKINLLEGGKIILDNAKIVNFNEDNCLTTPGLWAGIEVKASSNITLKNNSEISGIKDKIIISDGKNVNIKVESGSKLLAANKTALDIKNNIANIRVSGNSLIKGKVNIANCRGIFQTSESTFENGRMDIKGINVDVMTKNNFNDEVIIDNPTYASVKLRGSIFNSLVNIANPYGVLRIWNKNTFNHTSGLNIERTQDFDVVDNDFIGNQNALTIGDGLVTNANLIFKNRFQNVSNGVTVNGESSKLAIECNDHTEAPEGNDWDINNLIADIQGDGNLAAGNKFSSHNPQMLYDLISITRYHHIQIQTPQDQIERPQYIGGLFSSNFTRIQNGDKVSKCSNVYLNNQIYPASCFNGVKDQSEKGIDCGGPCPPCSEIDDQVPHLPDLCSNGVLDLGEITIDCGGICPPCSSCHDGIMNGNETGMDCGGTYCPPCNTTYCSDGIKNYGETDVDCGGPCPPCTFVNNTCADGIQNYGETSIDCGGHCPPCGGDGEILACYDGIQNNGETGIDCGGLCLPCNTNEGNDNNQNYAPMVNYLNSIYGSDFIPQSVDFEIKSIIKEINNNYKNLNQTNLINSINEYSSINPLQVYANLFNASPYLSPAVMHSLFQNSQHFKEIEIATLIGRNPSLKYDRYVNYLVYYGSTFSPSIKNNIQQAWTHRDVLSQIYEKLSIRRLYMHATLRESLLHHQDNSSYKNVRSTLSKKDDKNRYYQIYESFVVEGMYKQAGIYLNLLNENLESDPYYRNQLIKFKELHSLLMNYYYAGNRKSNLPSQVESQLYNIASGCYGIASDKAKAIFIELFEDTFSNNPCLHYVDISFSFNRESNISSNDLIAIIPNPAQHHITLMNAMGNDKLIRKFTISNVDGKIISLGTIDSNNKEIPIDIYPSGIYFIDIMEESKKITQLKFIKAQ